MRFIRGNFVDLEGRNKNRDDAVLTERLDKARLLSLAVRKMQISSRHLPYVLSYARGKT